ncbi:MAG: hypothetical protein IPL97_10365 [Niastella sp.]|nr:hypothetical protein [Niastella sp.]
MKIAKYFIPILVLILAQLQTHAQADSISAAANKLINDSLNINDHPLTDSFAKRPFSITYALTIYAKNKRSIAETYNGGVKTLFIKGNKAKLIFASLMRIQNVYVNTLNVPGKKVAVITKESGQHKYYMALDANNWKEYNKKYDSAVCSFTNDSMQVLNYWCKKALLVLPDKNELIIYYYPAEINKTEQAAEPMFNCIPGIVMQYEFHKSNKQKIVYSATDISFLPINDKIFQFNPQHYIQKKYIPGKSDKISKKNLPVLEDDEL